MEDDKKKNYDKTIVNAGLAGAATETVHRYGSAGKEHLTAYSGIDNENGRQLKKGLKGISDSKVNPEYAHQNIEQQKGFSAEVKAAARERAEAIIDGKKTRSTRTDDISRQSDGKGNTIGGTNDQLYDIAEVDKNGIYVVGTGRQLKFVGGNPKECAAKLMSPKFDKYRDSDVPLEVPSDFYDGVKQGLTDKAAKLQKQIENAEKNGKTELADKLKKRLSNTEKTISNLRKSSVSNKDAIFARLHPKLSTAVDVVKISHRAGVNAAKSGAVIGGGISFIRNSVAVIKGDKEIDEAISEVAGDTIKAAGVSYATALVGSALKGGMQNATSKYIQCLSKTNLPAMAVTVVLETGKTFTRFANGEIDGTQCLAELGEKSTGMLASAAGAAVGQILIPIPVVGGLVGGIVGYAMSSAYYNSLVNALGDAKLAREERLRIEAECKETIAALQEYRLEIEIVINNYLREHMQAFIEAFADMELAYNTGDVDGFIGGANKITKKLGGKPLFETKKQFDVLMKSTAKIEL